MNISKAGPHTVRCKRKRLCRNGNVCCVRIVLAFLVLISAAFAADQRVLFGSWRSFHAAAALISHQDGNAMTSVLAASDWTELVEVELLRPFAAKQNAAYRLLPQYSSAVPLPFGFSAEGLTGGADGAKSRSRLEEGIRRLLQNPPAGVQSDNLRPCANCSSDVDNSSSSERYDGARHPETLSSPDLVYIPPAFLSSSSTASNDGILVVPFYRSPGSGGIADFAIDSTGSSSSSAASVENNMSLVQRFTLLKTQGSSAILTHALMQSASPTQVALMMANGDLQRLADLVFGDSVRGAIGGEATQSIFLSRPTRDCRSILVSLSLFDDDDAPAFQSSWRGSLFGTDGTANSYWWRRVMGVSAAMWFRLLSPFAIYPTFAGVLIGNAVVTIGLLLVSIAVLQLYKMARPKRTWLDVCCICRFPSTTIGLVYNLLCGTALSAAAIISSLWHDLGDDLTNIETLLATNQSAGGMVNSNPLAENKSVAEMGAEEHPAIIVFAFFTGIFVLTLPYGIYYLCRHYLAPMRFVKIKAPQTRLAGFILPSGQIQPYPARTAFVNFVGDVTRQSIFWSVLPTLLPVWVFVTYLALSTYCAVFALSVIVGVVAQLVVIAHFKPYFSRARNFFESLFLLIVAICLLFLALALLTVENMHALSETEGERLLAFLAKSSIRGDGQSGGGGWQPGIEGFFSLAATSWQNAVLLDNSTNFNFERFFQLKAEWLRSVLVMLMEPTSFSMTDTFHPVIVILTFIVCIRIPNLLVTFMALDDPWRSKWDQPGSDEFGLSNVLWTRLAPRISTALFIHLKRKRKRPEKSYRKGKEGLRRRLAQQERSKLLTAHHSASNSGSNNDDNDDRHPHHQNVTGSTRINITSSILKGSKDNEKDGRGGGEKASPTDYSFEQHMYSPSSSTKAADASVNNISHLSPIAPRRSSHHDISGINAHSVGVESSQERQKEPLDDTEDSIVPFMKGRGGDGYGLQQQQRKKVVSIIENNGGAIADPQGGAASMLSHPTTEEGGITPMTSSFSQQPHPHPHPQHKLKRMALGASLLKPKQQNLGGGGSATNLSSVSPTSQLTGGVGIGGGRARAGSVRSSSVHSDGMGASVVSSAGSDSSNDNNSSDSGGGGGGAEGGKSKAMRKKEMKALKKLRKKHDKAQAKLDKENLKGMRKSLKEDGVLLTLKVPSPNAAAAQARKSPLMQQSQPPSNMSHSNTNNVNDKEHQQKTQQTRPLSSSAPTLHLAVGGQAAAVTVNKEINSNGRITHRGNDDHDDDGKDSFLSSSSFLREGGDGPPTVTSAAAAATSHHRTADPRHAKTKSNRSVRPDDSDFFDTDDDDTTKGISKGGVQTTTTTSQPKAGSSAPAVARGVARPSLPISGPSRVAPSVTLLTDSDSDDLI